MNILSNCFQIYINRQRITLVFFAVLVAALYTFAVIMLASQLPNQSDFPQHAVIAEAMLKEGKILPHFLFHLIIIAIYSLFGISLIYASYVVAFCFVFITFIFAYKSIDDNDITNKNFVILATCFLLLSYPITILFPYDKHLFFGYITASNVYYNPTILLLKVIALLHFVLLCDLLKGKENRQHLYVNILILGLLTALSLIAKPNYIIALLPALFALFFVKKFFGSSVSHWFLIITLGVAVPAFILLLWQYNLFYGSSTNFYDHTYGIKLNNSIRVGFFEYIAAHSEPWAVVLKLPASIAFPISVAIIMGRDLTRKLDFQISALMFAVSLVYTYTLVENATAASGNFNWSSQIAHFLLLFVCVKSYVKFILANQLQTKKSVYLPAYIGGVHFIFGIIWYLASAIPKYWML